MIARRLIYLSFFLLFALSVNSVAYAQAEGSPIIGNIGNGDQPIKILVAYQSKYGSTKQYAEWIQQDTRGDLVHVEKGDEPDLARYDIIIIGSSVRVGHIVLAPFIKDHWNVLKGKRVILFTTSGTPPRHPKIRNIYEKSLPEEIRKEIKYFPLPGRISLKELTFFDRLLMSIGQIMERDEELKKDMGRDFDGVRRENLAPLLGCLEGLQMSVKGRK